MSLTTTMTQEQIQLHSAPEERPIAIHGKPSEPLEIDDVPGRAVDVAEDESHYPTGLPLFLIVVSVALVAILTSMSGSIVSVAVPALTDHFHTVQDVGWYSAAFRLASCSFQFFFGKLYKIYSIKKTFFVSVIIYMLGSAVCAAAPSSAVFVLGRAICGFANAGVSAGGFTLLVLCIPMRKRPIYTSIIGSISGVSAVAAPMLGGVIVDTLGFRWCFWLGVPVGFVSLVGIFFCLPNDKPRGEQGLTWMQRIVQLDLLGNLILLPCLTCLFIALSWAGFKYAWNSPTVIGLLCTFGVLLGLFAWYQHRKGDAAVLPPRILYNRAVLSGFTFTFCCNSASMIVQYYLPTYYQAVRGYSAAQSGYFQSPLIVGDILGVLLQGFGSSSIGYYTPFMLIGSVLMPIFAGLMTTLTVQTALAKILVFSGIYGFAGGIGFMSPQSAVQMALPESDSSIGLSIILFAEQIGPAIFVSAAQNIFENRLGANLHEFAPSLNTTSFEAMGLSDLKSLIGPDNLSGVLLGFDKSLAQTWYLAVALACVTMVGSATMEWKSVKDKRT